MTVTNTSDVWSAAATVFVVVALGALTAIAAWEHRQRAAEHDHLTDLIRAENASTRVKMDAVICTAQLNVFIQMKPKERPLTLQEIPSEFWLCLPRSLLPEKNK